MKDIPLGAVDYFKATVNSECNLKSGTPGG